MLLHIRVPHLHRAVWLPLGPPDVCAVRQHAGPIRAPLEVGAQVQLRIRQQPSSPITPTHAARARHRISMWYALTNVYVGSASAHVLCELRGSQLGLLARCKNLRKLQLHAWVTK